MSRTLTYQVVYADTTSDIGADPSLIKVFAKHDSQVIALAAWAQFDSISGGATQVSRDRSGIIFEETCSYLGVAPVADWSSSLVLPGLITARGPVSALIRLNCNSSVVAIEVIPLHEAYPSESEVFRPWTPQSILSIATRAMQEERSSNRKKDFARSFTLELVEYVESHVAHELEELTRSARDLLVLQVIPMRVQAKQEVIRDLFDARLRIQTQLNLMITTSGDHKRLRRTLRAAVANLDALSTSITNVQMLELEVSLQRDRQLESARAGRSAFLQTRVSNLIGSLALPSLWLAFLGTNLIPPQVLGVDVPSGWSIAVATIGTLLASAGGWFGISMLLRDKESK